MRSNLQRALKVIAGIADRDSATLTPDDDLTASLDIGSIKGYEEWLAEYGHISPVVERVGARLRSRSAAGGRLYFLEGGLQRETGVAFDRRALRE